MTKPIRLLTLLFSLLPVSSFAQEVPIPADGTTGTEINTNDGNNFDIPSQ
jgi:hypothetical protein